jgi:uncharacterized membrane protein YeaQ/YmgE (transglycosylase-associated protein family)
MQLILDILGALVIGGVAGLLAGYFMKGSGFGVIGNIIVGMIGGFIGGLLLSLVNIEFISGPITRLIVSFLGAVVLLFIVGLIKRYMADKA